MILIAALSLAACDGSGENNAAVAESKSEGIVQPNTVSSPTVSGGATPSAASAAAVTPRQGDFQSFWARFRRAALTGDAATLSVLSAPVVIGHGELDDDPVRKLSPAQTPAAIAKIMANATPLDGAGHTARTLLESKQSISASELDSPHRHRLGDFVFTSGNTGWYLAELYLGDD